MKSTKLFLLEILDYIEFRWSAFLIYSIASVFSVSLRIEGFEANSSFIKDSIILGIGITTFTLVLLYLGFKVLHTFVNHGVKNRFGVLIILPSIGALRGIALFFEIDFYGFTNRISLLNSTISSLIYTSIYYGGASIFVNLLLRKNRIFHNEFQQVAFTRFRREVESNPDDKTLNYEEAMQAINSAITSKTLNTTDLNQIQLKQISDEIKFQIQNVLRPLSHRLWVDSFGEIRVGRPWQILKDATIELRFSKLFIIGYQFMVGIFGIGISLGLGTGIFKSVVATTTSLIIFFSYDYFWLKRHGSSLPGSLFFLLLVTIFPVLMSEIFSSFVGITTDFVSGVIIAPALPAILLVSAVYGLISRDKDFAVSAVRSVNQSELNNFGIEAQSKGSRELSEYLHNTLQSELLRISKKLEVTDDPQKAELYLSELEVALKRTRDEVDALRLMGIERLESVCQSWEGIAAITLKTTGMEGLTAEKIVRMASLIEEIITNSIRIGEADVIEIELTGLASSVQISILHNGSQVLTEGKGLGSISLMASGIQPPVFTPTSTGLRLDMTI